MEMMIEASRNARSNTANLVGEWDVLQLADPARPEVDDADRQTASENAAFLIGQLTGIRNSISTLLKYAEASDIEPRYTDAIRPARNCAELWQAGDMAIEHD